MKLGLVSFVRVKKKTKNNGRVGEALEEHGDAAHAYIHFTLIFIREENSCAIAAEGDGVNT